MRNDKGQFIEGHSVPQEWRESWREQFTGKALSEETKNKIRENRPNQSREMNPNWKGGQKINIHGYREILIGKKKYAKEHQLVWKNESEWGFIPQGFVVHHINGDKLDNKIENLACIPHGFHTTMHEHFRRGG